MFEGEPLMPVADQTAETRRRLLEAAGEVFAESGFHKATVREICKRARANVAAINYHFHDKQGLYAAVLKYSLRCAAEEYRLPDRPLTPGEAKAALRAIIAARLRMIFGEGHPAWLGKLVSREMIEPTAALDELVKDELQPRFHQLQACVRAILGPAANEQQVRLSAMSIVSQWAFYHHSRPVITRLYPAMKFTPKDIDALAGHIAEFSLAALMRMKLKKQPAVNPTGRHGSNQ
jgi:AcrR family transcriptional regulator